MYELWMYEFAHKYVCEAPIRTAIGDQSSTNTKANCRVR